MPGRVPGSKNFRFNRTVKGVGRLAMSAGTSDPVEYRYRDGILTKLIRAHAHDLLHALRAGHLSIGDLITADREGRLLSALADYQLAQPLAPAVEAWLPHSADAPMSRLRYRTSWNALQRRLKRVDRLSVRDLERQDWRALRLTWNTSGADWNRMRAMLSSFLTHISGHVHSPFRLNVMGRLPAAEESQGRVTDVTVAELWALVEAAPIKVRSVYASLAILGTGPKEQMGILPDHLNPARCEVEVNGHKKGRKGYRLVCVEPSLWRWVSAAVPCPLKYKWLRLHFKAAAKAIGRSELTMYDLRHLSGQLAADEGASERDIGLHLGHQSAGQTRRYTRRKSARAVADAIGKALNR